MKISNTTEANVGRPFNDSAFTPAFDKLCEYIDCNDECQYSITQLTTVFLGGHTNADLSVDPRTILKRLKWKYGNNLIIRTASGKVTQLFFITGTLTMGTLTKLERKEILEKAAEILRYDIRSVFYDCEVFPTLSTVDKRKLQESEKSPEIGT